MSNRTRRLSGYALVFACATAVLLSSLPSITGAATSKQLPARQGNRRVSSSGEYGPDPHFRTYRSARRFDGGNASEFGCRTCLARFVRRHARCGIERQNRRIQSNSGWTGFDDHGQQRVRCGSTSSARPAGARITFLKPQRHRSPFAVRSVCSRSSMASRKLRACNAQRIASSFPAAASRSRWRTVRTLTRHLRRCRRAPHPPPLRTPRTSVSRASGTGCRRRRRRRSGTRRSDRRSRRGGCPRGRPVKARQRHAGPDQRAGEPDADPDAEPSADRESEAQRHPLRHRPSASPTASAAPTLTPSPSASATAAGNVTITSGRRGAESGGGGAAATADRGPGQRPDAALEPSPPRRARQYPAARPPVRAHPEPDGDEAAACSPRARSRAPHSPRPAVAAVLLRHRRCRTRQRHSPARPQPEPLPSRFPTLRVRVPPRARQFVSSGAQSASIAVNGGSATVYDISSGSPLCTAGGGGRTCFACDHGPSRIGHDRHQPVSKSNRNGNGDRYGDDDADRHR